MIRRVDREPGDCLALVGIEHEVERQLRDETVKRDCLDQLSGGTVIRSNRAATGTAR
jgi:hypothetical protein